MRLVHYVLGDCQRCKRLVIGHLLKGDHPSVFYLDGITVVGLHGSRHTVRHPIDAGQRDKRIKPKEDCQNR